MLLGSKRYHFIYIAEVRCQTNQQNLSRHGVWPYLDTFIHMYNNKLAKQIQTLAFRGLLKMIGKGFVLFKINSSPSAFYIIKPTCISWLVFKVSNYFKKLSNSANPNVCLRWLVMTSSLSESKHPACLYSRTALNLIFGTLSARFKFNNVERWNWQSWFIYGRITAAAGLFSVKTAGAAGKSHF